MSEQDYRAAKAAAETDASRRRDYLRRHPEGIAIVQPGESNQPLALPVDQPELTGVPRRAGGGR